jgi:hypothetical protein
MGFNAKHASPIFANATYSLHLDETMAVLQAFKIRIIIFFVQPSDNTGVVNSVLYSRQAIHFSNRQHFHSARKYFLLGNIFYLKG